MGLKEARTGMLALQFQLLQPELKFGDAVPITAQLEPELFTYFKEPDF